MLERHGLRVIDASYSFHLLGQVHDIVDYWRREKLETASRLEAAVVKLLTKPVLSPLWRLAFYEAQWLCRIPWAVGLHITAVAFSD
jgi:hypothetical protein